MYLMKTTVYDCTVILLQHLSLNEERCLEYFRQLHRLTNGDDVVFTLTAFVKQRYVRSTFGARSFLHLYLLSPVPLSRLFHLIPPPSSSIVFVLHKFLGRCIRSQIFASFCFLNCRPKLAYPLQKLSTQLLFFIVF